MMKLTLMCFIFETENVFVLSYEASVKECVCWSMCVLVVLILNKFLANSLLCYKNIFCFKIFFLFK